MWLKGKPATHEAGGKSATHMAREMPQLNMRYTFAMQICHRYMQDRYAMHAAKGKPATHVAGGKLAIHMAGGRHQD